MPQTSRKMGDNLYYNEKRAFTFYKTADKLVLIHSYTFTPRAQAIIAWILEAYAHVLPDVGIYTPKQFADRIREVYSDRDAHNAKAIATLMDMDEFAIQEQPLQIMKGE